MYAVPEFGLQPADLFQIVFEGIGVAVAIVDRQEKLVFANRTALDLLGEDGEMPATFQEWRRKYRFESSLGHEVPLEQSAVMRAMRGQHVESEEVRVRLADGTMRWLLSWAYPFSVMGMSGVVALVMDETAEVELRRAASQLQRMETLGALAAGLAHDLNNMLDTITLNAALALEEKMTSPDRQVRLSAISLAAAKAAGLVSRLMQFSRTQELHYRPVCINDLVRDVLKLVRPLLGENISVRADLDDALPNAEADTSQIEQVLVNLIVNAIDAMPEGGELRISTAQEGASGVSGTEQSSHFVTVTVADTGIGISQEMQSVIFEPFFTTKAEGKGTGLGLSSVYGIVRHHHGNIRVCSAPGEGAAFVISLPVHVLTSSSANAAA